MHICAPPPCQAESSTPKKVKASPSQEADRNKRKAWNVVCRVQLSNFEFSHPAQEFLRHLKNIQIILVFVHISKYIYTTLYNTCSLCIRANLIASLGSQVPEAETPPKRCRRQPVSPESPSEMIEVGNH